MPLPDLTAEQRAQASRRAVAARSARADILAEVAAGTITVAEVLDRADTDTGTAIRRIKVADLLKTLRGVGPVGATRLLDRLHISENRRLGGLGVRQRAALIEATTYPVRWRSS